MTNPRGTSIGGSMCVSVRVCVRMLFACIFWCNTFGAKGGAADDGVGLQTKQSRRRDGFRK